MLLVRRLLVRAAEVVKEEERKKKIERLRKIILEKLKNIKTEATSGEKEEVVMEKTKQEIQKPQIQYPIYYAPPYPIYFQPQTTPISNIIKDAIKEKIKEKLLKSIKRKEEIKAEEVKIRAERITGAPIINIKIPEIVSEEEKEKLPSFEKAKKSLRIPKIRSRLKIKKFDPKKVHDEYPLVKWKVNDKEFILAKALIKWDEESHSLKYYVIEEQLSEEEKKILERAKEYVKEKLELDFMEIARQQLVDRALSLFRNVLNLISKKKLDEKTIAKLEYFFYRDTFGLERIEPLMHDPYIEDISCDGVNIPIFVYHSKPNYGSLETNIKFERREELDAFIYRLAQLCGKSISVASPLLDGILPDGSRVQATLGSDIARRGSNFTIRKFKQRILTPIDIINYGTATEEIFAYIWLLIECGMSILIAGPTASGKTTFLNAISLFIKPESKIISIEDTPELRLPHPNWIPVVERVVFGREKYAEVTMYDLLKAALRQRPDYIIVGEVRGKEANVLFHAMETGHPALGTIHAEDLDSLIDRLTSPPINIPLPRLQALDCVVFLTRVKQQRILKRRVREIVEIVGYNRKKRELKTNISFVWDPFNDEFHVRSSYLLERCRKILGMDKYEFQEEFMRRVKLLTWLKQRNVTDYREFFKYIRQYYYDKSFVDQLEIEEKRWV